MGTQLPSQKKRREREKINKIAHVLLKVVSKFQKERYVFKKQSRIKLATIYIPHTSIHMHILI
jgi:hypothetical protein